MNTYLLRRTASLLAAGVVLVSVRVSDGQITSVRRKRPGLFHWRHEPILRPYRSNPVDSRRI